MSLRSIAPSLGPASRSPLTATPPVLRRPVAVDSFERAALQRGAIGPSVEAWQKKLVSLGYLTRNQKASGPGVFGPRTEAATAAFQRACGLPASGQVTPATLAKMNAAP